MTRTNNTDPETDNTVDLVVEVANHVVAGRLREARRSAELIDEARLLARIDRANADANAARKRQRSVQSVAEARTRAARKDDPDLRWTVYHRAAYTCHYCGVRVVDEEVFRQLGDVIGEVLPYQDRWNKALCHPVVRVYAASWDHIIPVSRGGINANVVCACALHNNAKRDSTAEMLDWPHQSPRQRVEWNGLTSLLVPLARVASETTGSTERLRRIARRRRFADPEELHPGRVVFVKLPGSAWRDRYLIAASEDETVSLARISPSGGTWRLAPQRHTSTVASLRESSAAIYPFLHADRSMPTEWC